MITYNFINDVIEKENIVKIYGNYLLDFIMDNCYQIKENENIQECVDYESDMLGINIHNSQECIIKDLYELNHEKLELIKDIINKKVEDMEYFVQEIKNMGKLPKQADEENQFRILSFPWCISGNILTIIKFLSK